MSDERCACLLADSLDDVEDTWRKPGFIGQVREQRAGEWRPFGRLEDDGRASGERRCRLPGGKHERRVPGSDDRRGPCGHPQDAVRRAVRAPDTLAIALGEPGMGAVVSCAT